MVTIEDDPESVDVVIGKVLDTVIDESSAPGAPGAPLDTDHEALDFDVIVAIAASMLAAENSLLVIVSLSTADNLSTDRLVG